MSFSTLVHDGYLLESDKECKMCKLYDFKSSTSTRLQDLFVQARAMGHTQ